MDFSAFLEEIRAAPGYAGQIVYVREVPAREARYADPARPLAPSIQAMLAARGITRLYSHQAHALDLAREGRDLVVVTGTASGKSLCFQLPVLERLLAEPAAKALFLFPTKALCQDQFRSFAQARDAARLGHLLAGVYDGDTPDTVRRKLRDEASILFTNPDMLHAGLMPQHARWAPFLAQLRLIVLDELHVYNGIFGSSMTNVLRRFSRLCAHYGSRPRVIACSATIGNPKDLAERLTEREMALVDDDGSPRGKRTFVFWNPPRIRQGAWRSRRSANVEAHELMALLVQHGVPTITFSKAKMTAEMIHRYVCETLQQTAPHLTRKVSPYRGGYLPEERREIERRLFSGELIGVSTTPALELGIDVGGLDASILVGYPGTLASFYQQSGRAGRRERDSLVVLVGLDTAVNQYVMSRPDYLFGRPVEEAVVDPDNPYVVLGHLRCATHELPLPDPEAPRFGPHAPLVLRILEENQKVRRLGDRWYHAASETPQHEVSLRHYADANVLIEDVDTGTVIGEVNRYEAPPLLHPDAIYLHQGDTYRVLSLDLERRLARVKRVEVDYYTQPCGGTEVHHIDHALREKPFGTGRAYWGEVTAYFHTVAFERIHFYSLDAISRHPVDLPTQVLETMACWIVPPEALMHQVLRAGLDAHAGLRGIGYATRMLLPLFLTCDTRDFSHSIGSANSPWNTLFIYERIQHGLGFTEKLYERLHQILPAVLETIHDCPCDDGCPCCVGKPLRQFTVWNVERGEASIPSKAAARMILEGLLEDGSNLDCPDVAALTNTAAATTQRLEQALRRRLERMREPVVFHPIEPQVPTQYPAIERPEVLPEADVSRRAGRRRDFHRELRKRIAQHRDNGKLPPTAPIQRTPPGMHRPGGVIPPTAFPGKPEEAGPAAPSTPAADEPAVLPTAGPEEAPAPSPRAAGEQPGASPPTASTPIRSGDSLAARARRLKREREGGA